MSYLLPDMTDANISGKRIFLRADLDVSLSDGKNREVADDTRLRMGFPTLAYLAESAGSVVIAGKVGRPKGKIDAELTLAPVAYWIADQFGISNAEVRAEKIGELDGWHITPKVLLLENLQFYKEELDNDPVFAKKLASLADIYINEAFATSHRAHASVVGVPALLPHFAGFRLQEEVKALSAVLENPKRPLVVIIGGAKLETKLPLVTKMAAFADSVFVGGQLAQEKDSIHAEEENSKVLTIATLREDGLDITKESIEEVASLIKEAGTIVWNGPLGKLEKLSGEGSEEGSKKIAELMLESSSYTLVGGGDTVEFLRKIGLLEKFSFFSTGGGAMLAFLSGDTLPALAALTK